MSEDFAKKKEKKEKINGNLLIVYWVFIFRLMLIADGDQSDSGWLTLS